jgi:NADPH2:quinone reductase
MKAVVCKAFDGPDALALDELPDPRPGAAEIVVDVHAAAVTFMDTLMVSGKYQMKPPLPFAPGSDAAGIV